MDRRTEIRDFLTSRRARITPEQAGLRVPPLGGARRVAGLRREEVALLAGVSVPYYTRLERGDARGATDAVLDAISRALLLDDAERAHLFDLVRAAGATAAAAQATRRPARQPVRPELRNMLEAMSGVPAYIRNGRLDILTGNALARALFAPIFTRPAGQLGPLHLPGPRRRRVLPRLGRRRRPERRYPARRGRPPPLRQGPVRPDRRAVDPRRHLPAALGPARSVAAPGRRQAPEPPARRADDSHLRNHGARRRRRPTSHRVWCRPRQPGRGYAQPAGQL